MGQIDISMRKFTSRADVFSDFFNATVFHGEQIIQPSELTPVEPKGQYRDLLGAQRELERDVVKLWRKGGVVLSLLGIESQTQIDPDMAIRMFAYDALAYREQLLNKTEKRRYPIVSEVLYYGAQPWLQNRTLRETVQFPEEGADAIAEHFNDYKLNIVDMARFERKDVEKFRGDFRFLSETYYKSIHPEFDTPPFPGRITDYSSTADVVNAILGAGSAQVLMNQRPTYEGETSMYEEFSTLVRNLESNGEKRGFVNGEKVGFVNGEKVGFVNGKEIGREEGALQKARSVALHMRDANTPFDAIVATVEMAPDVVRAWFTEEDAKRQIEGDRS